MCLTISLIVSLALTANPFLASAQNKTFVQPTGTKGMGTNVTNISIVLVHGAWAGAASWSKVIPILQNAGHKVIAVQLALHSLADDVATVKRAIDLLGGPTILVGSSYGGEVITNAAYNNSKVKGLVYLRAFAPQEGQSISSFFDPARLPKGSLIIDKGGFAYLNSSLFRGQDVDPVQVNIMAAVQTPINMSILAEKSGPPAWKQLPTWYAVSQDDHVIPPALERMFAKQINATTIAIPSSHASLVSHPTEIAQLILNATKEITK